jgi:DNA gyrase subunit A
VVTVSHLGYVKRVPLSTYRAQRRGGKGRSGMQTREEDFVSRLFVASTHTPVLFFSSHGRVYKEKVWRLPAAAPQARGKALINILPLEQGELVTTVMPLPEDEKTWAQLDVMFATTRGTVRRNKLSDFVDVRRSGIIAMKLDEGEGIVDVQICTEHDDVLLTSADGQCIRFPVTDVRVFQGRTSMGVRGIALAEGDKVISLSILRHTDATGDERAAYLKHAGAVRRGLNGVEAEEGAPDVEEAPESVGNDAIELGEQRYVSMSAAEQFVLTISERGYGKRSSSYEYRITGRGGKGIVAMDVRERDGTIRKKTGKLIASFPVEDGDQLMLVTDGGQLIRTRVEGIRIVGRPTQGVIVFDTAEGERVVSVERISEEGDDNGG